MEFIPLVPAFGLICWRFNFELTAIIAMLELLAKGYPELEDCAAPPGLRPALLETPGLYIIYGLRVNLISFASICKFHPLII